MSDDGDDYIDNGKRVEYVIGYVNGKIWNLVYVSGLQFSNNQTV